MYLKLVLKKLAPKLRFLVRIRSIRSKIGILPEVVLGGGIEPPLYF